MRVVQHVHLPHPAFGHARPIRLQFVCSILVVVQSIPQACPALHLDLLIPASDRHVSAGCPGLTDPVDQQLDRLDMERGHSVPHLRLGLPAHRRNERILGNLWQEYWIPGEIS